ncbi:MAG: hypothetical protein ACOYOP_02110 [Microthrixaceae bacterium]
MTGTVLADLGFVAMGLVAAAVFVVWLLQRRSPGGERSRRRWIQEELARQEAAHPGGKFSDDEYLARLEALEDRWDDEHGG